MPGLFDRDRIVAPPRFNRWRVALASVAIHLCIGSVYAWSLFNPPLMRLDGVVAPSSTDWSLSQVVWIFTVAIVFLGLTAAVAGKWLERVGPRVVGTCAAICWGGGFLIAALGIISRQLWLVYLGYGVVGGCGLGLGYVSPVSTLLKWFPDRRGMATGLAIMGFGGGAIVATPLVESLLRAYSTPPRYLGPAETTPLVTEQGRRLVELDGQRVEAVVLSPAEASQLGRGLKPGVYQAGTGSTGVAATFVTLGLGYLAVMLVAAFAYRLPAPGWVPEGWTPPPPDASARRMISIAHVTADQALRTPQFYLLWVMLCFNVTAGIGVLGVAKTMMTEIFGSGLPLIVTSSFAATYVLMTSVFNMIGRFGWASLSDRLGRRTIYAIFFGFGTLLYLAIPTIAGAFSRDPSPIWLVAFYVVTMLIFTMYGGGFATIPAYLADLFGVRQVGAIHGRLLTAWSTAGVLGPLAITSLREFEVRRAIARLATLVDPARFQATFGAPVSDLDELVARKTVTIPRLLELAPSGTPDPSSGLYNSTMILMAGLLAIAFVANLLVRPVDPRHHAAEPGAESARRRESTAVRA